MYNSAAVLQKWHKYSERTRKKNKTIILRARAFITTTVSCQNIHFKFMFLDVKQASRLCTTAYEWKLYKRPICTRRLFTRTQKERNSFHFRASMFKSVRDSSEKATHAILYIFTCIYTCEIIFYIYTYKNIKCVPK